MQLDALVGPRAEVRAVRLAVRHGIARELAAVAVAARIEKAAGVHREDAVVLLGGRADELAAGAERGAHLDRERRRVLAHGQYAAIAGILDAEQQHAVFRVDGEHGLVVDGDHGRAGLIEAGLVDIELLPAVRDRLRMLGDVGVDAVRIQLPEQLEKGVARLLFQLFGIWLFRLDDLGVDVVGAGLLRLGGRVAGIFAPLALGADGFRDLEAVFIAHLIDDLRRDEIRRQPLVAHGVHGGVDVDGAVFFDERDVGVDAEEVEPLEAEDDGQHDGQHLERLFRLVGLGFFAAFGDARAALCRAKEFHGKDAPIAISKVIPF